jgi:hypothetical protein
MDQCDFADIMPLLNEFLKTNLTVDDCKCRLLLSEMFQMLSKLLKFSVCKTKVQ